MNEGLNVLSLFDGLSCGMLALERAGIKVKNYYASEIDKHAIKVSKSNYPNIIQLGDVTSVDVSTLPKIDLLIGGSPCQGFSMAGKQIAFDDPRSKLYFEYERILNELREINPNIKFLLENVKMKQEFKDVITSRLGVEPVAINSNLVSAQNRPRLYWANFYIGVPENKGIELKDIIQDFNPIWKIYTKKNPNKPKTNQSKSGCLTAGARSGGNHSDMDVIVFSADSVPTKNGRVCFLDNTKARRYSCEEWEILQTVPVGYTSCVSDSQRYKMLGNGWTVDVIAHIFQGLK